MALLGPIWSQNHIKNGFPNPSKSTLKSLKIGPLQVKTYKKRETVVRFRLGLQDGPRLLQDGFKMVQDGPKMAQKDPKRAPRWGKLGQDEPRLLQMCSNKAPESCKMAQTCPKMVPRWPQHGPSWYKMFVSGCLRLSSWAFSGAPWLCLRFVFVLPLLCLPFSFSF